LRAEGADNSESVPIRVITYALTLQENPDLYRVLCQSLVDVLVISEARLEVVVSIATLKIVLQLLPSSFPLSTLFGPKYPTRKSTPNGDGRRTDLDNATILKRSKESARTIQAALAYTELPGTFMWTIATRAQVTAPLSRTDTDLVFLRGSNALVRENGRTRGSQ
jgi:gamma-glutamyl phosphate reductase